MKPKLLYITDLHYQSKGRVYYEEDMYLSSQLSEHFDLVLCDPRVAINFMADFGVILFRNTGPVLYFQEKYEVFKKQAIAIGVKVFNELSGIADMLGKQYLVDLSRENYPVIPSINKRDEKHSLPQAERYLVKPIQGADSIGIELISAIQLEKFNFTDKLVQPVMDFSYEVSFYFINREFQYALYAPETNKRWNLERYDVSEADVKYAQRFIDWNAINYGIQRIDACRMPNGELFLMEIEDLNPYLSLDLLSEQSRNDFVSNLVKALKEYVNQT